MNMYEIKFDKNAIGFVNKLEHNIKRRIWNKLQQCKINPFRFLEHLEDMPGFKLRVGDYRLIIDVIVNSRVIQVLKVAHRKNIYEK